jgi:hypothetical protein
MSVPAPLHSAQAQAPTLGTLPDELLTQILSHLPSPRDLFSSCLVSKRLNKLADPVLHKSISFNAPKHHLTFTESLITRPRRGSLILNVRLEYPSHELSEFLNLGEDERVDRFSHAISTMSNLENLVVSVPESLCKGIGTLFNGPFDLACLKTCSLFYQCEDGGYWDVQNNIHIFSHPTLESLTLRRGKLDHRGFDALEKPEFTALKELHFIECDIDDDALSDILLHPEALQEFTITQLASPDPELEESPEDVEDYILALKSAQHSLESITIDFPTLGAENPLRLRDFEVLKSIQIRDYQLFGQKAPRMHGVGLPPLLETLEFLNPVGEDEEIMELLCYTVENKDILARKWEKLIVVEGKEGIPKKVIEACEGAGREFLNVVQEGDEEGDEND